MQCVRWRDSGQVGGMAQPKEADGGFPESWGITNLKEGATVKEVPGKGDPKHDGLECFVMGPL